MLFKQYNPSFLGRNERKRMSNRRLVFSIFVLIEIVLMLFIFSLDQQSEIQELKKGSTETSKQSGLDINNNHTSQGISSNPPQVQKSVQIYGIAAGGNLPYLSQASLDQYFQSLQALGVKWVRWDFDWSAIQREGPTSYQWTGTDRVVNTAKKYGINSLGIITYAPNWASDKACKSDAQCAPLDATKFAQFAGKVALRYRDSVTYWEIWNEPNLAFFWSPKPDAKKYADVLKQSYGEIKKANPSAVILSGGLAAANDQLGGNIAPLTFMNSLYASGSNKYFDAVALHPYSYPVTPQYKSIWNSWQQMSSVRQLMVKKGESGKKIWVTEYGAPTGGPGTKREVNYIKFNFGSDYMSEAAQKEMAQEVVTFYTQNTDWMGAFFWYSLQDNSYKRNTPENFFGLLRFDGTQKPAYSVFKNAISAGK